jgi:hypothetical protein
VLGWILERGYKAGFGLWKMGVEDLDPDSVELVAFRVGC